MTTPEERITVLEDKIIELEKNIELQYRLNLERQKEIEELQEKRHKEVVKKQEDGFFKQKIELVSGFLGVVAVMIGAFAYVVKKLKEAKKEVK
jgi:hypothetical protein